MSVAARPAPPEPIERRKATLARYLPSYIPCKFQANFSGKTMLRITVTESSNHVVVHLDGKLTGPWVEETRSTILAALSGDNLSINLQNLSCADDAGIALLRNYRSRFIPLTDVSAWIEQLLASEQQPLSGDPVPERAS